MKAILWAMLFSFAAAQGQDTKDWQKYDELLRQGKYDKVFTECRANLKEPYGKTLYLNHYYIGQSLCGKGYTQQGIGWYNYIRQKFPIDQRFAAQLRQSISKCGSNLASPAGTTVTVIINSSVTPSGVAGKSGFRLDCDKDSFENYDKLRTNDSLSRRVFPVTRKGEALASLRRLLPGKDYAIDTSGRFMVVYKHSTASSARVREVVASLETAYKFFVRRYALNDIDKLFTVYLVGDRYSLQDLARKVHDISISNSNIGYSSLNDLSLLGIANSGEAGTLVHELFHLMIRSEIGDISPWLDEGLACMYSVYSRENNNLKGSYDTWRVTHFKMLMNLKSSKKVHVPSLDQLVNYTWGEYQGETFNSFCDASVNYALSNFFALYLQSKNLDGEVIRAFKNRQSSGTDTLSAGPTDNELLANVFHQTMESITRDFYDFLYSRYHINMTELLDERPAYAKVDMPVRFRALLDTAETELAILDKTTPQSSAQELKTLKEEKSLLFGSVANRQRQLVHYQQEVIGQLSRSSGASEDSYEQEAKRFRSESAYLAKAEKDHEAFLAKAETDATNFIKRLRNKRQPQTGNP